MPEASLEVEYSAFLGEWDRLFVRGHAGGHTFAALRTGSQLADRFAHRYADPAFRKTWRQGLEAAARSEHALGTLAAADHRAHNAGAELFLESGFIEVALAGQ